MTNLTELNLNDDEQDIELGIPNMIYPNLQISGISMMSEVEYLMNYPCNKDISIPLYVEYNGNVKQIGYAELTKDYLILLSKISSNTYLVTFNNAPNNSKILDCTDGKFLEQLIRL